MTTFADGLYQYGGQPVGNGLPVPFTGKAWFVNPATGSDGNTGKTPTKAFATLYQALAKCTAGNNDVVYLIANGSSTGFARLSVALAASIDSTATAGTLVWNKANTHLVGVCAPGVGARASIRPPTGTYTAATFNAAPFITVSANGCYFANFGAMDEFSTGADGQILFNVTGSYNVFNNVSMLGFGVAATAEGAASRTLKVGGGGENTFINCQIGVDTITRSAANYNVEFVSGSARNRFIKCVFPVETDDITAGIGLVTGTGLGRWVIFDDCLFISAVDNSSSVITNAFVATAAGTNGSIILSHCNSVGVDEWGDTNAKANMFVDNVGGAATAGMMLAPTTSS